MYNEPFLLRPAYKDYLWGGDRLKKEFNKKTDIKPLAESWECSVHPDGESVISGGRFDKRTLKSVLDDNPDYMGTHPDKDFGFPILIKLIDAKEDLSLQVHPNDEYAYTHENKEHGKAEMWYVLDAKKDARLIYGFNHDTSEKCLRDALKKGIIERYLNKVEVQKDDVFFVKPGTVHAIGAGTLIAEIQESSNVTYRLYDYDRIDKNGNKRELHIDKAMEVTDFHEAGDPRPPLRLLKYKRGYASEMIARCQYFEVLRIILNTIEYDDICVPFKADELSFRVLLCIDGAGHIEYNSESNRDKEEKIRYKKGDCIFVPADSVLLKIYGKAEFLDVRC